MKKNILMAMIAALGLMGIGTGNALATTNTNGLVSTFSLVGLFSPSNSPVLTTNTIGNVVTSTYTAKPVAITTKSILNILGVEFGTSFPTGSKLAYSINTQGFVVLNQQGNFILNVATNAADSSYRFVLTNTSSISAASGKVITTTVVAVTNTVETISEYLPDYSIYYADGKGNKFHFGGLVEIRANLLETSSATTNTAVYKTVSIRLSGPGGGTFFNPTDGAYDSGVFTNAVWTASGANVSE